MKPTPATSRNGAAVPLRYVLPILLAACWAPPGIRAQEHAPAQEPEIPAADLSTRIPGPVTGGRFVPPPPPPPPKPVPADMRVESAVVRKFPGRNLTILRGEPSTLPDLPRPVPPQPLTAEQIALREALRARHRPPVLLQFGASVFDEKVSYVTWRNPRDPDKGYEAVINMNFSVFANLHAFLHEGVTHQLLLMHREIDTARLRRNFAWHRPVSHPFVPAEGFLILKGDPGDEAGTAPLRILMDLYSIEKERLTAANIERKQALREAVEWAGLNPKSREPVSHGYWLRPHRGSRYLAPSLQHAPGKGGAR